jgi:FkbM family methyltransferase
MFDLAGVIKRLIEHIVEAMGYRIVKKIKYEVIPRTYFDGSNIEIVEISKCQLGNTDAHFMIRDRRDVIQRVHRSGKFYEPDEIDLMRQNFGGGVFLDIGANVGNHSIYFAKQSNCSKVISLEPSAKTMQTLRLNILLNDLEDKIHTLQFALGENEYTATLYRPISNNGGATLVKEMTNDSKDNRSIEETVKVTRGDRVISDENITLIKIDTEGAELGVIKGLRKLINRNHPTIFVECTRYTEDDVRDVLNEWGYKEIYHTNPSHGIRNFLYKFI